MCGVAHTSYIFTYLFYLSMHSVIYRSKTPRKGTIQRVEMLPFNAGGRCRVGYPVRIERKDKRQRTAVISCHRCDHSWDFSGGVAQQGTGLDAPLSLQTSSFKYCLDFLL